MVAVVHCYNIGEFAGNTFAFWLGQIVGITYPSRASEDTSILHHSLNQANIFIQYWTQAPKRVDTAPPEPKRVRPKRKTKAAKDHQIYNLSSYTFVIIVQQQKQKRKLEWHLGRLEQDWAKGDETLPLIFWYATTDKLQYHHSLKAGKYTFTEPGTYSAVQVSF